MKVHTAYYLLAQLFEAVAYLGLVVTVTLSFTKDDHTSIYALAFSLLAGLAFMGIELKIMRVERLKLLDEVIRLRLLLQKNRNGALSDELDE